MATTSSLSVGRNVRRLRKAQGLAVETLAARAGLAVRTVTLMEEGSNPTLSTLIAVAKALDVTVPELVSR